MLALFLMSLLFGLTYVASKLALQEIGVFQLVFARYALAWLVLWALVRGRGHREPIHRRDRREFLLLTAVEPVGYFLCETFALRFTTPATVSLILALIPVFSMLFALVIVNERPHLFGLGGAAICFSGVYAIIEQQPGDVLAPAPVVGSLLALLAAMAAGLYNCLARRLTRRYAPLTLTYYQTLAGAAAFFPLALWQTARQGLFIPGEITLASVLYLALGGSVGGYFLLNRALSRFPVARVAVFANVIPVFTIGASFAILGERFTLMQFLGAGLVLLGVYITNSRQPAPEIKA